MPLFKALIADWTKLSAADRVQLQGAGAVSAPAALATMRRYIERGLFDSYVLRADSAEAVFQILNVARPADYRLRSLSVGDVVLDLESHEALLCAAARWIYVGCELAEIVPPEGLWLPNQCAACAGCLFIHAHGDHGPEIQRCDNCAPDTVTDAEAVELHAVACGCDWGEMPARC